MVFELGEWLFFSTFAHIYLNIFLLLSSCLSLVCANTTIEQSNTIGGRGSGKIIANFISAVNILLYRAGGMSERIFSRLFFRQGRCRKNNNKNNTFL